MEFPLPGDESEPPESDDCQPPHSAHLKREVIFRLILFSTVTFRASNEGYAISQSQLRPLLGLNAPSGTSIFKTHSFSDNVPGYLREPALGHRVRQLGQDQLEHLHRDSGQVQRHS